MPQKPPTLIWIRRQRWGQLLRLFLWRQLIRLWTFVPLFFSRSHLCLSSTSIPPFPTRVTSTPSINENHSEMLLACQSKVSGRFYRFSFPKSNATVLSQSFMSFRQHRLGYKISNGNFIYKNGCTESWYLALLERWRNEDRLSIKQLSG